MSTEIIITDDSRSSRTRLQLIDHRGVTGGGARLYCLLKYDLLFSDSIQHTTPYSQTQVTSMCNSTCIAEKTRFSRSVYSVAVATNGSSHTHQAEEHAKCQHTLLDIESYRCFQKYLTCVIHTPSLSGSMMRLC